MCWIRINAEATTHPFIRNPQQFAGAFEVSEGHAAPHATCHELKEPVRYLQARTGETSYRAFAPTFMADFKVSMYQPHVFGGLERVLQAVAGHFDQDSLAERIEVFGKLGYGASFLVGGQREDTPNNDEPITRTDIELGENSILNRWDHGAYGGLGIGLNLGKTQIFVEGDVYAGFRDAGRANFSQNRSISVNFGVSRELF